MADEQKIVDALREAFGLPLEGVRVVRDRRASATVPVERLRDALEHARSQLEFSHLCSITGLDEGPTLGLIYHLARPDGTVLNLKTGVARDRPLHPTVHDLYPCALLYERELTDLFGVQITGLPAGARYPLPDDWPEDEHPLRKDWQPGGAAAAAPERAAVMPPRDERPAEPEDDHGDR